MIENLRQYIETTLYHEIRQQNFMVILIESALLPDVFRVCSAANEDADVDDFSKFCGTPLHVCANRFSDSCVNSGARKKCDCNCCVVNHPNHHQHHQYHQSRVSYVRTTFVFNRWCISIKNFFRNAEYRAACVAYQQTIQRMFPSVRFDISVEFKWTVDEALLIPTCAYQCRNTASDLWGSNCTILLRSTVHNYRRKKYAGSDAVVDHQKNTQHSMASYAYRIFRYQYNKRKDFLVSATAKWQSLLFVQMPLTVWLLQTPTPFKSKNNRNEIEWTLEEIVEPNDTHNNDTAADAQTQIPLAMLTCEKIIPACYLIRTMCEQKQKFGVSDKENEALLKDLREKYGRPEQVLSVDTANDDNDNDDDAAAADDDEYFCPVSQNVSVGASMFISTPYGRTVKLSHDRLSKEFLLRRRYDGMLSRVLLDNKDNVAAMFYKPWILTFTQIRDTIRYHDITLLSLPDKLLQLNEAKTSLSLSQFSRCCVRIRKYILLKPDNQSFVWLSNDSLSDFQDTLPLSFLYASLAYQRLRAATNTCSRLMPFYEQLMRKRIRTPLIYLRFLYTFSLHDTLNTTDRKNHTVDLHHIDNDVIGRMVQAGYEVDEHLGILLRKKKSLQDHIMEYYTNLLVGIWLNTL